MTCASSTVGEDTTDLHATDVGAELHRAGRYFSWSLLLVLEEEHLPLLRRCPSSRISVSRTLPNSVGILEEIVDRDGCTSWTGTP
jgi:hypothetical protein